MAANQQKFITLLNSSRQYRTSYVNCWNKKWEERKKRIAIERQKELENEQKAIEWKEAREKQKELEDYQKAKNCFLKAIEIKSDYIEAHINLGEVFQELSEHKKAINCFKQAIIIQPNSANAYYNFGVTLGKLGEHQNAINYFQKAINLKPDYTRAHSNKLFNLFYLEEVDPKYYLSQAKKMLVNNRLLEISKTGKPSSSITL